jgi:hypothetical protein
MPNIILIQSSVLLKHHLLLQPIHAATKYKYICLSTIDDFENVKKLSASITGTTAKPGIHNLRAWFYSVLGKKQHQCQQRQYMPGSPGSIFYSAKGAKESWQPCAATADIYVYDDHDFSDFEAAYQQVQKDYAGSHFYAATGNGLKAIGTNHDTVWRVDGFSGRQVLLNPSRRSASATQAKRYPTPFQPIQPSQTSYGTITETRFVDSSAGDPIMRQPSINSASETERKPYRQHSTFQDHTRISSIGQPDASLQAEDRQSDKGGCCSCFGSLC